ncbi:MAG: hypothetical protein ACI4WS_02665 [Oscillospiraceae bacterium]
MCIIAVKDRGVDFPTWDTINRMWDGNPDGAGYMYPARDGVHIRKGFMTVDDFIKSIEKLSKVIDIKSTPIIMHFRIGTHGVKRNPANTHPFPVSADRKKLKSLNCVTEVGFAHNGIISGVDRDPDISDTMMYSVQVLSEMMASNKAFYTDKHMLNVIENTIDGSRMVFMDRSGTITKVGSWVTDAETGMVYSNSSYKKVEWHYGSKFPCGWDELDDYTYNGGHWDFRKRDKVDKAGSCYARLKGTDCLEMMDGSSYFVSEVEKTFGYKLYVDGEGIVYDLNNNTFYEACEVSMPYSADGKLICAY